MRPDRLIAKLKSRFNPVILEVVRSNEGVLICADGFEDYYGTNEVIHIRFENETLIVELFDEKEEDPITIIRQRDGYSSPFWAMLKGKTFKELR